MGPLHPVHHPATSSVFPALPLFPISLNLSLVRWISLSLCLSTIFSSLALFFSFCALLLLHMIYHIPAISAAEIPRIGTTM